MSNLSRASDLPVQLQPGLLSWENLVLDTVKACVHSLACVITALFTYLITVSVCGSPVLRQNPRNLLLCQHCFCISAFNGSGSVLHGLRSLRWRTARLTCWILFDLQVVMARGLTMTLTLMCMCTCLSICQPLRYPALIRRSSCWVSLLTWLLALSNPLVFTVLACVEQGWEFVLGLDSECSTALESEACIISALVLLALMALLIFGSYFLIYLEGRRAGHFSSSNSRGRRTILIHSLQMSLHILPAFIIITRWQSSLAPSLVTFLLYSTAQSLSPVVYGLRCKELQEELPRFVPKRLLACVGLRSANRVHDSSTGTITSTETAPSTGTGPSTGTTPSTGITPSTVLSIAPSTETAPSTGTAPSTVLSIAPSTGTGLSIGTGPSTGTTPSTAPSTGTAPSTVFSIAPSTETAPSTGTGTSIALSTAPNTILSTGTTPSTGSSIASSTAPSTILSTVLSIAPSTETAPSIAPSTGTGPCIASSTGTGPSIASSTILSTVLSTGTTPSRAPSTGSASSVTSTSIICLINSSTSGPASEHECEDKYKPESERHVQEDSV